jgi:hypothetical protein
MRLLNFRKLKVLLQLGREEWKIVYEASYQLWGMGGVSRFAQLATELPERSSAVGNEIDVRAYEAIFDGLSFSVIQEL